MAKEAVYKMSLNFGRQGDLEGIFVAPKWHIEALIENKIEAYFGEVLGKHSEISCTIDEGDIIEISDAETIVSVFKDNNIFVGYNPLDCYIEDPETGDGMMISEYIEKYHKPITNQ